MERTYDMLAESTFSDNSAISPTGSCRNEISRLRLQLALS